MVARLVAVAMSSRHNGRDVVMLCEECHSKMLAIGELLLVSCEPRPVFTTPFDLDLHKDTFEYYRDKVIDRLNHILIATRDVSSQINTGSVQWKTLTSCLQELSAMVISLTELSAHIAYLIAVNFPRCHPATLGVVNKYRLHNAKLDLKYSCSRLKRSCVDDLDPHMIVELCSTISRALSSITEVCKHASENASDAEDQNQFKLCVKSITSTTSCLVASLKRFKAAPGLSRLRRVMAFCDPVMATSAALVAFASEDEFIGTPARLTDKATEAHKSVLGMTMSIVSATIQMCKTVRDLVYDLGSARHRERIRLCVDSVDKASTKLRDLLLSCDLEPKTSSSSSSSFHSSPTSPSHPSPTSPSSPSSSSPLFPPEQSNPNSSSKSESFGDGDIILSPSSPRAGLDIAGLKTGPGSSLDSRGRRPSDGSVGDRGGLDIAGFRGSRASDGSSPGSVTSPMSPASDFVPPGDAHAAFSGRAKPDPLLSPSSSSGEGFGKSTAGFGAERENSVDRPSSSSSSNLRDSSSGGVFGDASTKTGVLSDAKTGGFGDSTATKTGVFDNDQTNGDSKGGKDETKTGTTNDTGGVVSAVSDTGCDTQAILVVRDSSLSEVESAVMSSALTASSPVLNLSMTSVTSFSDVDDVSVVD